MSLLTEAPVAVSVLAAGAGIYHQLVQSARQAQTAFEDALGHEYRNIANALPTKALLRDDLGDDGVAEHLASFYRYCDLSNEQVFLNRQGRVRTQTWVNWEDGIKDLLSLPRFARAWRHIGGRAGSNTFVGLRELVDPVENYHQHVGVGF